jgi:hypothetical protein
MPSDSSYWLISAPHRKGDDQDLFRSVKALVGDNVAVGGLEIPDLKVGGPFLIHVSKYTVRAYPSCPVFLNLRVDWNTIVATQPVRFLAQIRCVLYTNRFKAAGYDPELGVR